MRRVFFTSFTLCAVLAALTAGPAFAQISASGDVNPADPNTWLSGTTAYVGYTTANGSVTVTGGSGLLSGTSYLGYTSGLTGTVSIDGSGSSWQPSTLLTGYQGTGVINITNGGSVAIHDPANNYWNYVGSPVVPFTNNTSSGNATGTINITNGTFTSNTSTDVGLLGDNNSTTCSANGTININSGGQFVMNESDYAYGYPLYVGHQWGYPLGGALGTATGTINVNNGGSLSVTSGYNVYLGFNNADTSSGVCAAVGTLNIASGTTANFSIGSNSFELGYNYSENYAGGVATGTINDLGTFTCSGPMDISRMNSTVACTSTGTVNVLQGAFTVGGALKIGTRNTSSVGTSSGTLNIDGSAATMSCPNTLNIGGTGNYYTGTSGTFNISGGAHVTGVTTLTVNGPASLLSIDVGTGSSLTATKLAMSNSGTTRFVAGAGAAAMAYSPITISSGTWPTTGTYYYQGVGGVWSTSTHQFTVASAVDGTAGSPVPITPSGANQRVLISGGAGGTSVGVGFLSTEGAVSLTAATADTSSLAAKSRTI